MISTQDLEAIAAGRVMDSTQAPHIARELIAAREALNSAGAARRHMNLVHGDSCTACAIYAANLEILMDQYDAAREAE